MIKFFRKIRQNLLSEGKTGKYLKYAIGEILLVVIGILIALSINNWNAKRLEEKELASSLEQIITELETDIIHFNQELINLKQFAHYLNKIEEGQYEEIDLSQLTLNLCIAPNTRNFGISYFRLVESGTIKHMEDSQLRNKLQTYYSVNCADYNSGAEFHGKFVADHIEGPLLSTLNHKKGFLVDPEEVIEALENGKLMSLVNYQSSFYSSTIPQMKQNVIKAQELIDLISEKLRKYNI
jgi:hypothetical protein